MNRYLYEKDLTTMKYNILISTRHDRAVREIAADLKVSVQQLRHYLIEQFDMIFLENLTARYEVGKATADQDDPLAQALGRSLFTIHIPLLENTQMDPILDHVESMIASGFPEDEAIAAGKTLIGEAILK